MSDLESGLTASEIAEVFIQVLGGTSAAADVVSRLLLDCGTDESGYWTEVVAALRKSQAEHELSFTATLH